MDEIIVMAGIVDGWMDVDSDDGTWRSQVRDSETQALVFLAPTPPALRS